MLDLAGLAHDLRAPLAAIEQVVQLIVDEHLGRLSPKQHEALRSVLRRCIDLENLIGNVLDLARSETGRLQAAFAPVSLAEVVAASRDRLQFLAEYHQVHVDIDGVDRLPEVFADRDMLERLVTNLLSNALKVSPKGASVQVRGELASLTRVRLEVQDQGPGMDPAEVREVLRPFVRGTAPARGSGAGLGLAIVRRLVRAQKANLTIRTCPGKGTAVGIILLRFAPDLVIRQFVPRDQACVAARCALPDQRRLTLAQQALAQELRGRAVVVPDPACLTLTIVATDSAARTDIANAVQRVAALSGQPIQIQWLGRDHLLRRAVQAEPSAGHALPAREASLSRAS